MVDGGKTERAKRTQTWSTALIQHSPQLKVALLVAGLLGLGLLGTFSTFRISAFEEIRRAKRQFQQRQQPLGGYCTSQNRVPFINPQNEISQGCPGNRGCPNGYSCEMSTTNQFLCCGLLGSPFNGFIFFRDSNGRPLSCGSGASACPGGARCMPTQGGPPQQMVCAVPGGGGLVGGNTCPLGYQGRFLGGRPQTCAINLAGSCTAPYACVQNENGMFYCCRPSGDNNLCPGNQRTLKVGSQLQYCSQLGAQCPVMGYTCQNAMAGGQRICCGQGELVSQLRCASGRQPFLLGINPYYCTPAAGNCPENYNCELSSSGQYVCCAGQSGMKCRDGSALDLVGGQPSICSVNGPETCNLGFVCQQTTSASQTACCREPRCSGTGVFYKFATCTRENPSSCGSGNTCEETSPNVFDCCSPGEQPGTCPNNGILDFTTCSSINGNECPTGYSCVATSNNVLGCCGQGAAGTCPTDTQIETGNEAPCVSDNDCGTGYTCIATNNGVLACCGKSGGDPNTCANNQLPDLQNGQPRRCSPANASCRQGYLCLKAADGATDICCRGPRCPGGVTVGQGPDGAPLACTIGGSECPTGQTCKTSTNMPDKNICCPNNRRFLARSGRIF